MPKNLNYTAYLGINIFSNLPVNLMQKALEKLSNDMEFVEWWSAELIRQNKEYAKAL